MTTFIIAFAAGILSFVSPCIFPLIPAFLAYLAGTTLDQRRKASASARKKILVNTLLFVGGFSLVFSLLGVVLSTVLAGASYHVQRWLGYLGGVIIILFGLHLTSLLRIPWLEQEHKMNFYGFKPSYITSFIFGASFAVGWTPCIGPILGSILLLAASQPASAFGLLMAYSLGLAIPFILVAIFTAQASQLISRAGPALRWFGIVVGVLLIILGILVFTGNLGRVSSFMTLGF
ncbi:cytochrome C biogenesis protein [Candidatus Woesearchaeota archaeon]|nr:MAG: cytochrome C biogenesis protein [Candidatus Woesearchaeota archaeon]